MAERAVGHAHVGDVGHVRPVRRLRLEPAFHEVGPAARALRRFGGDGRPAAAHAADSRFPHDVHHLVAADLGRIPVPRQQLGVRLAVPVHGHEGIGMDLEDVAGRRLVPGGHAADGPGFEHAVAARRDEPAVQRSGQRPADRPDPETVLEFVDVSDHQRRVGSSRAAKKSRRRRQYLVRPPQSRDLGPRTLQLRHRVFGRLLGLRRDRGVRLVAPTAQRLRRDPQILGDLFDHLGLRRIRAARLGQQPDGLRLELRRVSRLLAMVPSSPIELGEMRNKNQFISKA